MTEKTDIENNKKDTIKDSVESKSFREAMSRIPAAVHIVTTKGQTDATGSTVSAFCSVTDQPPTVLVCVNKQSRLHKAVLENGCFCVNTLDAQHEALSDKFAGRFGGTMAERFEGSDWISLETGAPALTTARICFDCKLDEAKETETHSIFLGHVQAIAMRDPGDALLHVHRRYHALEI